MNVRAVIDGLDVQVRDVVVLSRREPTKLVNQLGRLLPDAAVHLLGSEVEITEALARLPQPQLIIDAAKRRDVKRLTVFREAYPFLQAGGAYVVQTSDDDDTRDKDRDRLAEELARAADALTSGRKRGVRVDEDGEAAAHDVVEARPSLIEVRQPFDYRVMLRESDANSVLDARYGSRWGQVIAARPPLTYTSPVKVSVHGERAQWNGELAEPPQSGETIHVPELCLRQYADVACWAQQRVAMDNYWLPDTFRHHLHRRLAHRSLFLAGTSHARLPPDAAQEPQKLSGSFYYFDSEYPAHYGHFLTDMLSRHWGWKEAVRRDPDVRPLVSLTPNGRAVPAYQRPVFEALGVDVDRMAYIAFKESVQVEWLYAATPAFAMPHYASPELAESWSTIADAFMRPETETPRLLFAARRTRGIRSCLNTEEVEGFFADLGFAIVYPEDHDFAEQVTMFAKADIIAGFAGSNLFNTMFTRDKTVIAICPDTYTATNEHLILSITGGRLHYFLAEAEVQHPPGGWRWAAYQSNFRFDLGQHGAEIREIVERGDR